MPDCNSAATERIAQQLLAATLIQTTVFFCDINDGHVAVVSKPGNGSEGAAFREVLTDNLVAKMTNVIPGSYIGHATDLATKADPEVL